MFASFFDKLIDRLLPPVRDILVLNDKCFENPRHIYYNVLKETLTLQGSEFQPFVIFELVMIDNEIHVFIGKETNPETNKVRYFAIPIELFIKRLKSDLSYPFIIDRKGIRDITIHRVYK